jgi:predicted nucleic-acid-binding Zn-ribbon protein
MNEDFEIEDRCPKCASTSVSTRWDEFGIIRIYLRCNDCLYTELVNPNTETTCDNEKRQPWEADPDSWKN